MMGREKVEERRGEERYSLSADENRDILDPQFNNNATQTQTSKKIPKYHAHLTPN
jgi:hypothetical protein